MRLFLSLLALISLLLTIAVWYALFKLPRPPADAPDMTAKEWVLACLMLFGPPAVLTACLVILFR
mgnify:CR=1 FL=1